MENKRCISKTIGDLDFGIALVSGEILLFEWIHFILFAGNLMWSVKLTSTTSEQKLIHITLVKHGDMS